MTFSIHRGLRQLLRTSLLSCSQQIEAWLPVGWRRYQPLSSPPSLPERCRLVVVGYGATPCHWTIHAWLHRCSLPPNFQISDCSHADAVGLHLQPVALSRDSGALEQLRRVAFVLDPSIERVLQLRELGLRAYWLDPQAASSGWLDRGYDDASASRMFGLPAPSFLREHGHRLCLGSAGERWEHQLQSPNWGLPGFADMHVPDAIAARLLAGWLNACNRCGLQLIRLSPTDYEYHSQPFSALDRPEGEGDEGWVPPLLIDGLIDSEGLEVELAWARSGQPLSPLCPTPTPQPDVLWDHGSSAGGERLQLPTAAVCVSLYNYGDCILSALDSVYRQTHAGLELIVVDDASTDGGEQIVCRWLEEYGRRFRRALLLRHAVNGGLAAARNTAFAAAEADWCFVLDADNNLEPEAVALCLALARTSPPETAVVHPLVELRSEVVSSEQPDRALLTRIPWQREALRHGNQIDAMALVRRSHWQAVGGFSHIPDGWEDYDFWCKLIDAGFHGIVCPQRLAIYNRHPSSMQLTSTLKSVRTLNRLLTARHPWLQLEPRPER